MEELISSYRDGNVILFVGAGVSKNLGLPTWSELIDHIAIELGYDPAIYKSFGDSLALAEYYRLKKGSIGPLRSWMDTNWHSTSVDITKSKVHELIAKAHFPMIYTTNYDRWLEHSFDFYSRRYIKVAGVSDIPTIRDGVPQIIKFHGDFDDDDSIVLDESAYFERLEFETPLDIKLRSDVLGKSVLFVGYSLSDVNLRYLFYKLAKLWRSEKRKGVQPKSYFFTNRPNPVQEAILEQWEIKVVVSDLDDPQEALTTFLERFQ
ncbi:SIR2 family NAD-dependent protein deacylase [Thiococcus pfennigii]|uniref:SIR2 family NAD-dependent protein deacylase n=1 Tax=Thiococcus pfennigii TaxID=1057 RepID=UPI001F5BAF27|nr:SIR2 family protein [Thiococcus pfennigii]MBK1730734.1 Sir2 family NAD-dependent protein deacetylase [Thiococcus pfennigii]